MGPQMPVPDVIRLPEVWDRLDHVVERWEAPTAGARELDAGRESIGAGRPDLILDRALVEVGRTSRRGLAPTAHPILDELGPEQSLALIVSEPEPDPERGSASIQRAGIITSRRARRSTWAAVGGDGPESAWRKPR
jgi:hypothetical protein